MIYLTEGRDQEHFGHDAQGRLITLTQVEFLAYLLSLDQNGPYRDAIAFDREFRELTLPFLDRIAA